MNEKELAFLMIGSPQVKVGVFGFAVVWKISPDPYNFIESPKYARLSVKYSAMLKSSSFYSLVARQLFKYKLPFPLHIRRSNNVNIIHYISVTSIDVSTELKQEKLSVDTINVKNHCDKVRFK